MAEKVYQGIEVAGPYGIKKNPEITLDIPSPSFPKQAMVYRTVDTNVSKDDALEIAEKFGMSGPVEESMRGIYYVIKDDPYTFEIEKEAGYMTYTWEGRWSRVNPRDRPKNLPTDEESRKIAERYLTTHDLMPEGAAYSSIWHVKGFFRTMLTALPFKSIKTVKSSSPAGWTTFQ